MGRVSVGPWPPFLMILSAPTGESVSGEGAGRGGLG